jgi:hypothetical protein
LVEDRNTTVVSQDELLSRAWQGRIVDENRQSGARLPRCPVDQVHATAMKLTMPFRERPFSGACLLHAL